MKETRSCRKHAFFLGVSYIMHILDNVLVQREFEERFLNGNVRRKGAGGMSVWFFL